MKPSDQPHDQNSPAHNPKSCSLCGTLRHPAQSKAGRQLAKHLKTNPLPTQQGGRS